MSERFPEPTMYTVKVILILDKEGNRLIAKYYDSTLFPTVKQQKTFESTLFRKTHRTSVEVIMLSGVTCIYKNCVDLCFYVVGSSDENEIMLLNVLGCLFDSINYLLRKNVEKRTLLENLDSVFLILDEVCDNGIFSEADALTIVQRVAIRQDDIPLGEQTVASVLHSAKEQLKWSLLK